MYQESLYIKRSVTKAYTSGKFTEHLPITRTAKPSFCDSVFLSITLILHNR